MFVVGVFIRTLFMFTPALCVDIKQCDLAFFLDLLKVDLLFDVMAAETAAAIVDSIVDSGKVRRDS